MAQLPKLISKTKIMMGYQCHKNIYYAVHKKDLIPPVGPELQALFDQGNSVTEQARKMFPTGVLVDNPAFDFGGSLKKTRELLAAHTEFIFEAAFEYKGCYARADVIAFSPLTQRWSVIEVKSTTKVKEEHLDDVGLQVWIMANAGLPIEKISLMHLNSSCKFPDFHNLFTEEDITDRLREKHKSISPRLNEIFTALRSNEVPEIKFGEHCFEPRECQFLAKCRSEANLPTPGLFDIPGLYGKKWELFNNGQLELNEVRDSDLSDQQKIFKEVLLTGKRYINSEKIKELTKDWKFPLVFLDFETINPAIPRYAGTSPFFQVPFQFSVHILNSLNEEPTHLEFLFDRAQDPRPLLIKKLLEACEGEGSVVAYFGRFEAQRIQELEDYSPEHQQALLQIRNRIVDPLPILREAVYDSKFGDSFSIKSVGPALLGDRFSYDDMPVGDGGAAQRAYARLINSGSETERQTIRSALLEYCKKDTLVMVELVKWLYKC